MEFTVPNQKNERLRKAHNLLLALLAMAVGFGAGAQIQRHYSDQRVNYWMGEAMHWKLAYDRSRVATAPATNH